MLLLVAISLFASLIKDDQQNLKQTKPMRILTQNLYLRPPLISTLHGDYKDERLEQFKNILGDYDIICLQECFSSYSKRVEGLIEYAKLQGFHSALGPGRNIRKGTICDSGLLILSKYNILETETIIYSTGAHSDKWCSKGAVSIKIEVSNVPVYIFNTHLQASYKLDLQENDKVVQIRKAQLHEFKDFVNRVASVKEDKVVICGDFNINSRAHRFEYSTLLDIMGKDEYLLEPASNSITYYPWKYRFSGIADDNEKERLDYIFYKNFRSEKAHVHDKEHLEQRWKSLSDHFAVSINLLFDYFLLISL
eukprot:NODE_193_length_15440_cov_0.478587.p6 type:complete len:308 gc:universal NODE_193_length_15440_cov_0.478587:307-1230(+)